ncbi:hypothetical protein L1887_03098 [Cichorium endivia]|nr:hypothetical protein L1887_03098 [Cichorium endivia]
MARNVTTRVDELENNTGTIQTEIGNIQADFQTMMKQMELMIKKQEEMMPKMNNPYEIADVDTSNQKEKSRTKVIGDRETTQFGLPKLPFQLYYWIKVNCI